MALPKWTDERTQQLVDFVGEGPISQAQVADAADELETSTRSVSSKLRKMGYEVELADSFENGHFSAKSIQGKILSMELTSHVKPAEKQESVRTYSPEEEATFISMVNDNAFVEEIADALGKSVNSIRGKALSLLRSGDINAIPKQKETKGSSKADPLSDLNGELDGMTVEEIADEIGKTVRGVKTMLTRRGLTCADYDGAARKEKASS